jgi:hypothetical protein
MDLRLVEIDDANREQVLALRVAPPQAPSSAAGQPSMRCGFVSISGA